MLNEKFTFCYKITNKWNLTKSHATQLKSKTCMIKEHLLKLMSYNQVNQSYGSYDETVFLTQIISCRQKNADAKVV